MGIDDLKLPRWINEFIHLIQTAMKLLNTAEFATCSVIYDTSPRGLQIDTDDN